MPKPRTDSGEKNLIHARLKQLRQEHGMSQRDLAHALQLMGIDIDKNVITRIETNQRYVTDIEIQAFARLFHISCDALICGVSEGKKAIHIDRLHKKIRLVKTILALQDVFFMGCISNDNQCAFILFPKDLPPYRSYLPVLSIHRVHTANQHCSAILLHLEKGKARFRFP